MRKLSHYLWKSGSRNRRKIVVLIVVAHVESDEVQRAVVGIGFKTLVEHVMFRNEVARNRV
jgi:hypothetical protein